MLSIDSGELVKGFGSYRFCLHSVSVSPCDSWDSCIGECGEAGYGMVLVGDSGCKSLVSFQMPGCVD